MTITSSVAWRRVLAAALLAAPLAAWTQPSPPSRHLLIVVDGLRPDYVTEAVMPNLVALGKRGVVFARHHSVYPTVTRVNASSISTGAYPERHGLMGNSVFFPKVDPAKFLDTSNRGDLLKIAAAEGQLLTAATLGQSLQAAGQEDAGRQLGLDRVCVSQQSHGVGWRDSASGVHAPGVAGRGDEGAWSCSRPGTPRRRRSIAMSLTRS